ncbi:MAG: TldD/PmbA family protein [Cyanobacteria bacterium P01_G01_bin.54]
MTPLNPEPASQLIERAQQAGASDVEVYQSQSFSQPVIFEANRLKQLESNQAAGMVLRVWHQGRPGLAVAYGAVNPQVLVEKAIALAQLTDPEPIELATPQTLTFPTVGCWQAVEPLMEQGQALIAHLRDRHPELLCHLTLQCEQEQVLLLNSRGCQAQYASYSQSLDIAVEWVRGEDFLGIYEGWSDPSQLRLAPVLARLERRLAWAAEMAASPRGQYPVLFTPKAAELLWDVVVAASDGQQVVEGASPWSQRWGDAVIAGNLTLRQDPSQGSDRPPIDDEGTSTQPLTLIDQGRLTHFYCDRQRGRQLGQASTGNGFRSSLGRPPTPSLINLITAPGNASFWQLLGSLDRALIVDQVLGGGADLSGELSVNVDLGFAVERGEIVGRVKDTMVAGNVYDLLQGPVVLGNDREWQGDYYTPSVVVEGMAIVS